MPDVNANIPEVFDYLFTPVRYKVGYGGRGAAKSWNYARALIIKAIQNRTRILCTREVQKSIRESVHRLLCDQIDLLGLSKVFTITEASILCANGSEFIFEGLFRNINRIKSLEGVDICWCEEAESISEESWQLLLPTIRKENAEIWISFNTAYESDPTYQRFVIKPPENCITKLINYYDNPFFPETLKKQMESDKVLLDDATWKNIWLGEPKRSGGRIWIPFESSIHVERSKLVPIQRIAETGNCFASIDPHSAYYPFIVFGAIVPKNNRLRWPEDFYKVIYDEWPNYETLGGYYAELRHKVYFTGSLGDIARVLISKEAQVDEDGKTYHLKQHQRFVDTRFAKGAAGGNWSTATTGMVQEFARTENGGITLSLPPERLIDAQRAVLIDEMRYNKLADITSFNEPSVLIYPRCKNLIRSLNNHRFEEGSEREADTGEKDPSDAFRIWRAGISEWRYKKPETEEERTERRIEERYSTIGNNDWMGG